MSEPVNIKNFFTPNIGTMGGNLVSKTRGDRVIWGIVIILTLVSLLVVYSSTGSLAYKYSRSTESYLFKQFGFIILGVMVIYFAHREGFNIASVTIKKIIPGEQIPGLPLKSIIAVYEYDNKEWDDLMLMITLDKTIKLAEIPVTSYMFMLNDERRGKNIRDAAKN